MSARTTTTTDLTGRAIGTTTIGAAGGAAFAGAVGTVFVYFINAAFGIEVPSEVENALVTIIAVGGALLGGKLSPTNMAKVITEYISVDRTSEVTPPPVDMTVQAENVHVEEIGITPESTEPETQSIQMVK